MKVASYYSIIPDNIKYWWPFWEWAGRELVTALGGETTLIPCIRSDMMQKKVLKEFDSIEGNFDIVYCERFNIPTQKLKADFVYTIIDDYVGNESLVHDFLERLRPNLLCSMLYYKDDLRKFCENLGIKFLYLPWFVIDVPEYVEDRPIRGMMSGCVGAPYPVRGRMYKRFQELNRSDVVLSCSMGYGQYSLTKEEFLKTLNKTRYYFSGGILDFQIPLKFMEACSHGACLVSPDLPMMKSCGFVDGENYVKFEGVEQIEELLDSNSWQVIGKKGRLLIKEKHTVQVRAKQILEQINEGVV